MTKYLKIATITLLLATLLIDNATAQSNELAQAHAQYQALKAQGRFADAEPFARIALKLSEQQLGKNHRNTAIFLSNLAFLVYAQGRYAEAEPFYTRALAVWENLLEPDDPIMAHSLTSLAILYDALGRHQDAEPLLNRALKIREKAFGRNHPQVAQTLNNLAALHIAQGRYSDAEPLYKRSLTILEKTLGRDHTDVALSINNIAVMYVNQGRYAEAEPLYRRSLEIKEKGFGPNHQEVAYSLNNLAILNNVQGQYAKAEPLFKRSLTIREQTLGPNHPEVAQSLSNLAEHYRDQGQYEAAEPLFKRALAIFEQGLTANHPAVATSLNELATLYSKQGRFAEAEPLYKRSLALREKVFGVAHPDVAGNLSNLATLYHTQGKLENALDQIRRASAIHRDRAGATQSHSAGTFTEQKTVRSVFMQHIDYAAAVANRAPKREAALIAEAFEASQLARATSVGAALAGMGARFAARDDRLASAVRRYQDATKKWRWLDKTLIAAASQPPELRNEEAEQRFRNQLNDVSTQLKELNKRLNRDFPAYAELASPQPSSLTDTQKLLGPDEALLSWLTRDQDTFLWVVRSDRASMHRLNIGQDALTHTVNQLRQQLDPSGITRLRDIPHFDTSRSFDLYQTVFAPAEPLLEGVAHLLVVPGGALQSLPLGVLISEKPSSESTGFNSYREAAWLTDKYALTTLPTISSLRALRRFAKKSRASRPFRGFGDPLLEGHPGGNRGVTPASLFTSRGLADVDAIRSQLSPLPETAAELQSMATTLGASNDDLSLRGKATEHLVKTDKLKDYRVLAFATHGLIAGDLQGLAEPALVLTPPISGTEQDDGLLTASEVAQLELNSDLVILSACNTASNDGSVGAEALSGLAKAFFYAGSRTLLVSHWPVSSDASVLLTTRMLENAKNENIGQAEALRQSMLELMDDKKVAYHAHPMFWAPFVIVGEGGVGHQN